MKVSLIHEDRMTYGVCTEESIEENILADRYYKEPYCKHGIINKQIEDKDSTQYADDFMVKRTSIYSPVRTLSGGNIQKVVAARECTSNPEFLLACQPTRGIDIGAAEMIRKKIIQLRDSGVAVLLISADLSELLEVSDSIMVIFEGEIVAFFEDAGSVNDQMLGEYMLGLKKQTSEELGGLIHES